MTVDPYFAFVGPDDLRRTRLTRVDDLKNAHQLDVLIESPGLLFLGRASSAHMIPAKPGCILWGSIFDRRSASFEVSPNDSELLAPAARFLTQFWGSYAAFRSESNRVEVFRDPSGAMPVYYARCDGLHILTSAPHSLFQHGLLGPSIDWTIVTQALAYRDLRPASTALRGVSELLPGTRLVFGSGEPEAECIWSPWDFGSADREIGSFHEATKLLRESICQVGSSWARATRRPIVELSGGLDSSIVAAALANGGATPTCATFIPVAGDSDERHYARSVAEHLGIPLVELELDLDAVDVTSSDAAHLPRPSARNFARALDRPLQKLGLEIGADMFFSGGGGDHIFCHLQSSLPAVDLFRRRGPSGVGRTILDVADVADVTLWEGLRSFLRRTLERQSPMPTPRANKFLSDSSRANLPWPAGNPWLRAPAGILPGKRRHVWALVSAMNHLEGCGRQGQAPINSPLLCQPIVETCLRIPSWLWFEGGRNRAVARQAAWTLLPEMVTQRRTKAAFDSLGARVISANRIVLREMLCEGLLAREGIIDREQISGWLGGVVIDGGAVADLLAVADVEAWVRAWQR